MKEIVRDSQDLFCELESQSALAIVGGRLLLSGDWHCYLDASDWMELVWAGLLLLGEQVVNRHEFIH